MGLWQDETDPAWNLATEEYLLDHVEEPCFLVWRNDKAVVIGRNQNALAEVHKTFVDPTYKTRAVCPQLPSR
ncbi:lipoyl protein ligase domain-containing protein [Desulfosoma sp.]